MVAESDSGGEGLSPRPPSFEDLRKICHELNIRNAKYLVVGGMALNFYGRIRATHDIDFLVDPSPANVAKIKEALSVLEDKASEEVEEEDVQKYTVVRVADEVVVDLIGKIGDVTATTAETILAEIDGVLIPFASLDTLIETKKGLRAKDTDDLRFLLLLKQSRREK